ncbi:MAG: adenosylcobinamide amidohydrolase [Blautia sp.]
MELAVLGEDVVKWEKDYIAILFHGKRRVLSTGPLNGGIHTDLQAVFNLHRGKKENPMYGATYREHMEIAAKKDLGLNPRTCTGLMTAALMENGASSSMEYEGIRVTALVTAGIEKNGGRVGEEAFWHEHNGIWRKTQDNAGEREIFGTINILLFLGANLTEGAMERALVTCTEAKTAAIQELCIASCYSSGLATGSGTDGTIITADMEADTILTEAGKHCKIGELIGKTVKQAVKEALYRQTGVDARLQHNVFRRLERYGITREALWEYGLSHGLLEKEQKQRFWELAQSWAELSSFVLWSALEAHLLDEYSWGLITAEEREIGRRKLRQVYASESFRKKWGRQTNIRDLQDEKSACLEWIIREILLFPEQKI